MTILVYDIETTAHSLKIFPNPTLHADKIV